MFKYIVFPFMIIAGCLVLMIIAANAQDVYRPIAMTKSDKTADTGFWCLTRDEIATAAKFAGVNWMADVDKLVVVMDGHLGTIEVEFTGDCATSAKVVR